MSGPSRVLITGANGHLGRRLIAQLAPIRSVTAVVRSRAARDALAAVVDRDRVDVVELDYRDAAALRAALGDCGAAVHLVGILKQTATNRYVDAHEHATAALVAAATDSAITRIVYVSILGAAAASSNAALASKARAERLLLDGAIPAVVLRVPMVLGEGDYASAALRRRARSRVAFLLRGASLEQPIYAGDVVAAIVAALGLPDRASRVLELAGPTSLPRAELVRRAAALAGNATRCVSLPLGPVLALTTLLERVMADPPVTRAMLEVLDHDDCIDPVPAAAQLGIQLTSLDATLARCVAA